jgi:hypothetical protein
MNDQVIQEAQQAIQTKRNEPVAEKVTRWIGKGLLVVSAASLGGALYQAIHSSSVEAALCR